MKLHVVFDPNGDKVGDLDSMQYAMSKLDRVKDTDQELQVNVANGLVIHCFRLLVKEGKIKPHNELILYNLATDPAIEKPIYVDINGTLSDNPIGFLDAYGDILCKLI